MNDVAHARFASRPENLHHANFQVAERELLSVGAFFARVPGFQKANHRFIHLLSLKASPENQQILNLLTTE